MNRPATRRAAFTLIELLVVIAIIGTLAAVSTPLLRKGRIKGRITVSENRINQLVLAIDSFQGQFGNYPPSSLEDYYETSGNRVDSGIESVILCLSTQKKGGPFFDWEEDALSNLDNDTLESEEAKERLDWIFGDNQLREYLDGFDNPLIYIHNKDYEDTFTITHEGGTRGTATGGRSEKSSTFFAPTGYQLWSCGPNETNDGGMDDDIGSWE